MTSGHGARQIHDIQGAIAHLIAGHDLGADEVATVFAQIMDGGATPAQIGGLLVALRMKGETPDEIAGAARAMRARAVPLRCPDPELGVDTCGTGGDGAGTVNVSTLAAVIAAGAGACVAKHGNRAQSSRSGSADVLEALGVKIDASAAVVEQCMRDARIGFAFAPAFHAATRHALGPRRELGTRTIFNLLGPLTNPAGVKYQVVGVFADRWCAPVATALGQLGARRAFVLHGHGGLDEIAVCGPTLIAEWSFETSGVHTREVRPRDFGFDEADPAELAGGDAAANAQILRTVLAGEDRTPTRAVRKAAVMEAGVALVAVGLAGDFAEGAARAAAAIDEGRAVATLERWIEVSRAATSDVPEGAR